MSPNDPVAAPAPAAAPARRAWRLAGYALLGMLVLAVTGIALGEAAHWSFLREPVQRLLSRSVGTAVDLDGRFAARLVGRPWLHVAHLRVAPAHGLPVPHLLDAHEVLLRWRWGELWRWHRGDRLRVESLAAKSLDARLLRTPQGQASWQIGPAARTTAPDGSAAGARASLPGIGRLEVGEGHVVWDDAPARTQLDIRLSGSEGAAAQTTPYPGYRGTIAGRFRGTPLKLQVRAGGALPLLQDDAGGDASDLVPVHADGDVGAAGLLFDGGTSTLIGPRRLAGALRLRGPSLARVGDALGVTLPQTGAFELQGRIEQAGPVWRLKAERFAVGRTLLRGDFAYDTSRRPGRLQGRLEGPRLALADLAPAIGRSATAPRSGRALPQRQFDLPSLKAMDADVQMAIDELDFGTASMAPLRSLKGHLLLGDGVLRLEALSASVASGRFAGTTQLDARRNPARWHADLDFSRVDLAGWIRGLRKPASATAAATGASARTSEPGSLRAYATGELAGHVKVRGTGRSTSEILGSLDGQAQLQLRHGTLSHLVTELAGLDVAQALGVALRGDKALTMRCARVDVRVDGGVARPRGVVDNPDSTLRMGGKVDLRDESLALVATAQPKDISPLTLRAPVLVGGTLAAPSVGVDGTAVARQVLAALALGVVGGAPAALLPLVDLGDKPAQDPCAAGSAGPPAAPASAPVPAPKATRR